MSVSVEQLSELVRLFDDALKRELENHTDLDEVDVAALSAVLARHEQMVLERKATEIETYLTGNNREWDRAIEQVVRDLRAVMPPEIARGGS